MTAVERLQVRQWALILAMAAGFGSISERPGTAAQVNLERYVALGDSLTAGVSDGALHRDAQLGGYARRLSRQAGLGRPFEQPLMSAPGIPAALRREAEPGPVLAPRAGLGSPVNLTLPRPYDNLAVPGSKVGDVLRTSTDRGGLRDLVLRGLGTQLEQALLLEPTFVSLWIGTGDALGAAITGIVLDGVTLTPLDRFSDDFERIVRSLAAGGVRAGVVGTIPRVTELPYVSALETTGFDRNGLALEVGGTPVPLLGPDGPLSPGDFVLLSASPRLARGDGVAKAYGGTGIPLPDEVILSRLEARQINDRIRRYNAVIRRAAAEVGFAVAETADLFEQWRLDAVGLDGQVYDTGFPNGGLYSLDGIHPSSLGQGLLANAFLEAINQTYGASLPLLGEDTLAGLARAATADGFEPASRGRWVFSLRASKNLRFALALPRPGRLKRLKHKALERLRDRDRRRPRPLYELPAEPVLAERGMPATAAGVLPT